MTASILAGAACFACAFGAGVILGTIRVLVVVPAIGELAAVMRELPLILTWSWLTCGWLPRRLAVPSRPTSRLLMGATAFALLMAAALGLSVLAEGRSVHTWLAQYQQAPALIGLLGQVAFGLIPPQTLTLLMLHCIMLAGCVPIR